MKVKISNEDLILLERDICKQKNNFPSFNFLNRDKVAAFYNDNKEALNLSKEKTDELMNKHVQLDSQGNWSAVTVNEQFVKWAFLSEADEDLYKKKYDRLMKTLVEVTFL